MQKYQMHYRIAIPWHRFRLRSRCQGDGVLALRHYFRDRFHTAEEAWSAVKDFQGEPVTRAALNEALIGCLQFRSHLFDLFIFQASDPSASIEVYCYPNVTERQAELRALKVSDQILHLHDLIQQELARAGVAIRLTRIEASHLAVRAVIHGVYGKYAWKAIGFLLTLLAAGAFLYYSGVIDGARGKLASMAGGSILSYFIGSTLTATGFWFRHLLTGHKREVEYHVVE